MIRRVSYAKEHNPHNPAGEALQSFQLAGEYKSGFRLNLCCEYVFSHFILQEQVTQHQEGSLALGIKLCLFDE